MCKHFYRFSEFIKNQVECVGHNIIVGTLYYIFIKIKYSTLYLPVIIILYFVSCDVCV